MSTMKRYKIEDCFHLRARIGWQGLRAEEFTDYGPYLVTGTDFRNGRIDWDNCYHVDEHRYKQDIGIQLKEHDLLITKDGTIGKTAVVQDCPEKVTLNSGVFVVRAINANVVPEFLYYVLNSHQFELFMRNILTGSTIKHLNQEHFYKFSFEAPDAPKQSKIAEVLATVDETINKTRALIEKYKNIKVGMMQDLLTNGLDENGNIRSPKTHKYKDSRLGRIPKEWDAIEIGDIVSKVGSGATPRGGQSVYENEGILFLRSQNITLSGLELNDVAYITERIHRQMRRSWVEYGDVLLNITGASIGRCCLYPFYTPANVNQHVCIIRSAIGLNQARFIFRWLSYFGQNQIGILMAGGNREGLNYEQVKKIMLPKISDDEELQNILDMLDKADEKIHSERDYLAKLQNIKRGLMQDLLTNTVTVDALM